MAYDEYFYFGEHCVDYSKLCVVVDVGLERDKQLEEHQRNVIHGLGQQRDGYFFIIQQWVFRSEQQSRGECEYRKERPRILESEVRCSGEFGGVLTGGSWW